MDEPSVRSLNGAEPIGPTPTVERMAGAAGRTAGQPLPGVHEFDRMELSGSGRFVEAHAKFTVQPRTGVVSIQIIDSQTNEVIREIPSEEVLQIAEQLQAYLAAHKASGV